MTDWKSDLQKAAEYLTLDGKMKAERAKPSSTPLVAQYFEESVSPERLARPAIPGRPEGPPTEIRKHDPLAKTVGSGNGLALGVGNRGKYEKQPKPKGIRVPRPLAVPLPPAA